MHLKVLYVTYNLCVCVCINSRCEYKAEKEERSVKRGNSGRAVAR